MIRSDQLAPIKPCGPSILSEDQRSTMHARSDVHDVATSPPYRDRSNGSKAATSLAILKYSKKSIFN